MPLGGRKGETGPGKSHKNQVPTEAGVLVCNWTVREEVNWGQINIYSELRQQGKDTLVVCMVKGVEGGSQKVLLGNTYIGPGKPGDQNG